MGKSLPQGLAAGGQAGAHGAAGKAGEPRLPVPGLPAGGEG